MTLACVILMMHLLVLFHSFDHELSHSSKGKAKNICEASISDISEECFICDVYLDLSIANAETISLTFIPLQFISNNILKEEDQFIPVSLYFKQSRSPPSSF
ncbi:hypothetical protein SAMN04489761_1163 [Tenacibaculum sp. MAR_2009_124]|uniref:hypothetical protein n=1 Tax=Tenacibaculum sp. MAR_2009_124 TaxID=1250059 RepID=UPI000898B36E|nr:hypothetical protein [Tenacibaculum sp. MAR_2009_124]SEB51678.1 hypothetical protein SAMN04489761_1163 [Tenacibaculum sp. MAR_2009_124]